MTAENFRKIVNIPDAVYYVPNFISEEEEAYLLKQVESAPKPKWTHLSNRSLQNWGGLPHPKGMVPEPLPEWLARISEKIGALGVFGDNKPNHVLVNKYLAGQGIMPHEDGSLYYPTVSNLTLGSHGVLDFYRPIPADKPQDTVNDSAKNSQTSLSGRYMGSVLLERRSLFLMQEDMYKHHLHGIQERKTDLMDENILNLEHCQANKGEELERDTRISFTIRYVPKVLKTKIFLTGKRR